MTCWMLSESPQEALECEVDDEIDDGAVACCVVEACGQWWGRFRCAVGKTMRTYSPVAGRWVHIFCLLSILNLFFSWHFRFFCYLHQGRDYAVGSVCMSVVLSVCEQDYCRSHQLISSKLGIVIGPTSWKNWLTCGCDLVWNTDSRSLYRFSLNRTIVSEMTYNVSSGR